MPVHMKQPRTRPETGDGIIPESGQRATLIGQPVFGLMFWQQITQLYHIRIYTYVCIIYIYTYVYMSYIYIYINNLIIIGSAVPAVSESHNHNYRGYIPTYGGL